jgi:DNA-binding MarR family transcriptional regulator
MTELARAVMLSSGGLTRLVGRLEDRGLVRREPDEEDGRAFQAALTSDGARSLAQARRTHDAVLEELLARRLSAADLESLALILGRALELS